MHVRPARGEDHPRLLEVWERSVRATHHFLNEAEIAALRPFVAQAFASSAVEWWVLLSPAGEVIGFLGYTPDTIGALFIDPDHHGKGGGRMLVGHAQALSGGALSVEVNEANVAAVGFYESLGFTVTGRSALDSDGRPYPILHMRRGPW